MKRIILAGLVGSVMSLPLYADGNVTPAGTNTPGIDQHIANQEKRIQQGEKSGALTQTEAAHLDKREAKLQSDEAAAKADGTVTRKERHKLRREEKQDGQAIARKKHNANVQKPAPQA
jgi:hypothetical protein